jgi:MraZ protein
VAFRGHFEYSLDAKNRLTIPAKFRASFSDGLVLAKWLDPCVAIFTPDGFDQFNDSFIHYEISGFSAIPPTQARTIGNITGLAK